MAERLWSARDVTDVDNMYQRLQAIDGWSTVSVGLRQHTQLEHFTRLGGSHGVLPLQIFAQALEPAQYYTCNHLEFQAGNYHQFEPLNRLADALLAQSDEVRQMQGWVEQPIADPKNVDSADVLRASFTRWQNNAPEVATLVAANYQLAALKPVVAEIEKLSALGLRLVDIVAHQGSLSDSERASLQQQLDNAAQIHDELVIAAVYPLQRLLQATTAQK